MSEVKIKVSAKATQAEATFNQLKHTIKDVSHEINSGLKEAIVGAFAVEKIKEMITATVEWASQMSKVSDRLGVSIENVEALGLVAAKAGKSFQDIEVSLTKLEQAAAKALGGSGKQKQAFANLGISENDLKHLNKVDLLSKVAQGASNQTNSQATANLAPIVGLGNVGTILGAKGSLSNFGAFKDEKKANGEIASAEDVEALAELHEKFEQIANAAKTQFIPVLTTLLDWIYKFARGTKQVIELIGTEIGAFVGSIEKFDIKGLLVSFGEAFQNGIKAIFDNIVGIITGKTTISEALNNVTKQAADSTKNVLNATLGDHFTDTFSEVVNDKLLEQAADDKKLAEDEAKHKKEIANKQASFDADPNRQAAPGSKGPKITDITDQLKSDNSLLKGGNLLGVDTNYRLERINILQLDALNKIAENTDPDNNGSDGETPSSDF